MHAQRSEDVMELMSTGLSQGVVRDSLQPPHVHVELCGNAHTDTCMCDTEITVEQANKHDSDSGRCTPQEVEIFRTGSPSVRFEEILIDVINTTTIHVDWCPVVNSPDLIGYKIRYAIKDNSSYNEVFVTSGISSYTISGLKPNTEYIVTVCAIDEKENVIQQCGWASQRTDEIGDHSRCLIWPCKDSRQRHELGISIQLSGANRGRPQSSPYVAMVVAAVLLTTAFVVPLTILIVHNYREQHFDAPTITAVAAICLLLLAIVVPVTLLFVRNCGQCDLPNDRQRATAVETQDTTPDATTSHEEEDIVEQTGGKSQPVSHQTRSTYDLLRNRGRPLR